MRNPIFKAAFFVGSAALVAAALAAILVDLWPLKATAPVPDEIAAMDMQVQMARAWKSAQRELPDSTAVVKREVRAEVERREGARAEDVQIVAPGRATATFPGGVALVQFAFRDPLANCPVQREAECARQALANPLGFQVIAYKKGVR